MNGYKHFGEFSDATLALETTIQDNPAYNIKWKITLIFYAALHSIQDYLVKTDNTHYPWNNFCSLMDHSHRRQIIQNNSNLSPIYSKYCALYSLSITARYCPHVPQTTQDLLEAKKLLAAIKQQIRIP